MLCAIAGSRSRKPSVSQVAITWSAMLARPSCVTVLMWSWKRWVGEMTRGVGEHDPVEPVCRVGPEPLADHAAHRQSAPVRGLDIQGIEDREHVAPESLERPGAASA